MKNPHKRVWGGCLCVSLSSQTDLDHLQSTVCPSPSLGWMDPMRAVCPFDNLCLQPSLTLFFSCPHWVRTPLKKPTLPELCVNFYVSWNCLEIGCFSFILLVILSVRWLEYLSEIFFKASGTLFSKLLPTVNKYLCLPVCLCFWTLLWNDIFWWDRCPCWMQDDGVLFRNFPPICCSHFISHKMHKIFFGNRAPFVANCQHLRLLGGAINIHLCTPKYLLANLLIRYKTSLAPTQSMHIKVIQRRWYDIVSLKNTKRDWSSTAL